MCIRDRPFRSRRAPRQPPPPPVSGDSVPQDQPSSLPYRVITPPVLAQQIPSAALGAIIDFDAAWSAPDRSHMAQIHLRGTRPAPYAHIDPSLPRRCRPAELERPAVHAQPGSHGPVETAQPPHEPGQEPFLSKPEKGDLEMCIRDRHVVALSQAETRQPKP